MVRTSARLLGLLSLFQSQPDWQGRELAQRLGVTTRTVRRDVDRLRDLGYPIDSTSGTAGGYRLGVGGALPPLLLGDEEAVAVAVGLRAAAAGWVSGVEEPSLRALGKIEQLLPSRLRHRVAGLGSALLLLPGQCPTVDAGLLAALAAACRAHEGVRLRYGGEPCRVEPYRLVRGGRDWYLLAFDLDRDEWRAFRVDRIDGGVQPGARFSPRPEPGGDAAAFVSDAIAPSSWLYRSTILFLAPLETVTVARTASPAAGRLKPRDATSCLHHTGAETLEALAVQAALTGIDFEVLDPSELREHVRALGERLVRAAGPPSVSAGPGGAADASMRG
ncbi:helix-turn-helix transcriptional regulator [Streptacidiphilus sp. N1-3]|uniref:Helix-turn-helix transcriptional regulator n=1 Tax=Streptacidiphilus alkalitolerans TaxID=3342712 RepID=A0ABV6X042_9ACTN